jgi:hypothetical protein
MSIIWSLTFALSLPVLLAPDGLGAQEALPIPQSATWRYFKGLEEPPAGWNQTEFDDSVWLEGRTPFGFGAKPHATDLADMFDNYSSVYARRGFTVLEPGVVSLRLSVDYDDAFVAFINGVEVARSNLRDTNHDVLVSRRHESVAGEDFELRGLEGVLNVGCRNVLAVEGRNFPQQDDDFLLAVRLEEVDCNANGLGDSADIASGASQDCNANGVPDECDTDRGFRGFQSTLPVAFLGPHASDRVFADFDGNGLMDAAVHADTRADSGWLQGLGRSDFDLNAAVWLYLNPGGPSRLAGMTRFLSFSGGVWGLTAGDFDADGRDDLAVAARYGELVVVLDVTEVRSREVTLSTDRLITLLSSGDFDGDGTLDLLAVARQTEARDPDPTVPVQLFVFLNNGDATFSEPVLIDLDPLLDYRELATGDFDGDGTLDLILRAAGVGEGGVGETSWLLTWENRGGGTLALGRSVRETRSPSGLAVADVDGDGLVDVVSSERAKLWLYINLGDDFLPLRIPLERQPEVVVTADLENDGDVDVVVSCEVDDGGEVLALLGFGDGLFSALISLGSVLDPRFIAAADFTGNGAPDILAGKYYLQLLRNRSHRGTEDQDRDRVPDDCNMSFVRGDCDGDGRVGGSVNDALILLNFNFLGGPEPRCLAACDADSSGKVRGQLGDALYLLNFSFLNGPGPAPPFPDCGLPSARDQAMGCQEPPPPCRRTP